MQQGNFSRTAFLHLFVFALMGGSLVRCDCEDVEFRAAAKYTPDAVLDFGDVSVTTEKKMDIVVLNEGTAGLTILEPNVSADPDKWRVVVQPDLFEAITPGKTSSISVTYRPCPAAWETRTINGMMVELIKEGFDFTTCMEGAAESADLNIVEVDTLDGTQRITLSARPVKPPSATVFCQNGTMSAECNLAMPDVDPCNAMTFNGVTAGEEPCELVVEIRNTWVDGKPVGDLHIEGIDIQVQNIEDEITVYGPVAGFTTHKMDDSPLNPNPGDPFIVSIPAGMQDGRERFKIRFSGIASGTWDGRALRDMTGVKLFTNDPLKPVISFAINGTGSAPDIDWQPSYLPFGPVNQGMTSTLAVTITNSGDADLRITSIGFKVDTTNQKFNYTTDRGSTFPIVLAPAERMFITVAYTPIAAGVDQDYLVLINNDIKENNRVEIPIAGGAVPKLQVDPLDTLPFPGGSGMRRESVRLANIGTGELVIQRLTITGPQGDTTHPSLDDFSFGDGCSNPCERQVPLCFPADTSCTTDSETFVPINYLNTDISNIDYAELHIFSTDPTDPEHVVVLSAPDDPCLYPTPIISYEPRAPCKGMPVVASGAMSLPGGPNGTGGTIVSYTWEWLYTPAATPAFTPTDGVTTTFIPTDSGVYLLGLRVKNDCGAESPTPASETIMVAETCN
jgi:hypothetical protein